MSETTSLARPYARAAFERARDEGKLSEWSAMLELAANIAGDSQVRRIVDHPNLSDEQLLSLFTHVGGENMSASFVNFLQLMQENDRLILLPEVASLFEHFRARAERTLKVSVTSAADFTPEQRDRLVAQLAQRFDREIIMDVNIDASMLGGAVIRAGDTVIDGSLDGRLDRLREVLTH